MVATDVRSKTARPGMLVRSGKAMLGLLLNWGMLIVIVIGVLAIRNRATAEARAPLPPPRAHLSVAEARRWQHFPSYRGSIPVLLYHGINTSAKNYSVTPRLFAQQMLALKVAGFHAITLSQYADFVHGKRRGLPAKPILLTFDDGRLDAYREANNVLRNYGFHATMFTFAAWPTAYPGFSVSWGELQSMQRSGIWNIQEHGGRGHEYVTFNAAGARGGADAFLRYLPNPSGHGGYTEDFRSFVRRVTSDILWGAQEFGRQIPGFRRLAFAVPYANYGQELTNDSRIPQFMLPWLRRHFPVVFGGDYLDEGRGHPYQIGGRFSPKFSYRITMGANMQLPAMYCRLRDWVTRAPIWREYRCLRPGPHLLSAPGRETRPAHGHDCLKDSSTPPAAWRSALLALMLNPCTSPPTLRAAATS